MSRRSQANSNRPSRRNSGSIHDKPGNPVAKETIPKKLATGSDNAMRTRDWSPKVVKYRTSGKTVQSQEVAKRQVSTPDGSMDGRMLNESRVLATTHPEGTQRTSQWTLPFASWTSVV